MNGIHNIKLIRIKSMLFFALVISMFTLTDSSMRANSNSWSKATLEAEILNQFTPNDPGPTGGQMKTTTVASAVQTGFSEVTIVLGSEEGVRLPNSTSSAIFEYYVENEEIARA